MIYEFAVDPAEVATWGKKENYRYFKEKFGIGTPRVISEFPVYKKWKKKVFRALDSLEGKNEITATDRQRIIELLGVNNFNSPQEPFNTMIKRIDYNYDGNLSWLENAVLENKRKPFHAILSRDNPNGNEAIIASKEIGVNYSSRWDISTTQIVSRNLSEIVNVLSSLCCGAERFVFIDYRMRLSEKRWKNTIQAFIDKINEITDEKEKCLIELVSSVDYKYAPSPEHYLQECENNLTIPEKLKINVILLKQKPDGQKLHNRYVLTDIGGIQFGTGLDEGNEGETDDLSLLDKETYYRRWQEYCGDNRAFDVVIEHTFSTQKNSNS